MKLNLKRAAFLALGCGLLFTSLNSCSSDDSTTEILNPPVDPPVEGDLVINDSFEVTRCTLLPIEPTLDNAEGTVFDWRVISAAGVAKDSVIGSEKQLNFISLKPGQYVVNLTVTQKGQARSKAIHIKVNAEASPFSAHLFKVYDFLPSVGQFTNDLPKYVEGDTKETMILKAENSIKGAKPASMISLGGFGGYVVFGFDHTVVNVSGKRDFRVLGNAFWANANPNQEGNTRGGSCEPGVILVAYDKNKNGVPDEDEWYEIAGSEYHKAKTIKNYEITFHKPDPNKEEVKDPKLSWASDLEYIRWTDNQGNSGYKPKNTFHRQNYYPNWITENQITFKGTLLPKNAVEESGTGSYWVLYSYAWGYVDNAPNNDDESAIDIAWAVDKTGKKVHLPGVDFIKVYTGVNQEAGWLGETSTEVSGAVDLHLANISIPTR